MRIISWNCNGGLRNKTAQLDALDADLIIVQECEDPAHSTTDYHAWAGSYLWTGEHKHKGIGVFAKGQTTLTRLDWHGAFRMPGLVSDSQAIAWQSAALQTFLPVRVNDRFNLLAVWTKGQRDDPFAYIGQLWKYLQIHRQALCEANTILLGDLNSNAIWDKPSVWWNHSDVVRELQDIGLCSLYHAQSGEAQGAETAATYYMYRHLKKGYHIDHVFVPTALLASSTLTIGQPQHWLTASDHVPLIIDIPAWH